MMGGKLNFRFADILLRLEDEIKSGFNCKSEIRDIFQVCWKAVLLVYQAHLTSF